jgi:hypothetical protein
LKHKIEGTDGTLEAGIETSTFSNNSACNIVSAHHGRCETEARIYAVADATE